MSEEGYDEPLERTRLSEGQLDDLAQHLPNIEMVASGSGVRLTAGCSCGWYSTPEISMMRAGREYDVHLGSR